MEHSTSRCTLETPLRDLQWIAVPRLRALERLGLLTVGELLQHYPRRYEDRTRFDQFPTGDSEEAVCVCGSVAKTQLRRIRGRMRIFDVVLKNPSSHALSSPLVCRWFNSPWVEKMILNGQRLIVHGKPKRSGSNIIIAHPEFEAVNDDAEISVHVNRIAPIHGSTEGMTPRIMRRLIWDVLERMDDSSVRSVVTRTLDRQSRAWALRQIHFPESSEALAKARQHLVLEEFFLMQLTVSARRAELTHQPGTAHTGPGELMRRLHESLPFPLTAAQHRAIQEIRDDLAASRPMNRLLHGDVGSGKTLVALSAMLLCVESGYQAVLMAPTQILAEQHYLNLRRLCDPLGIRVALRTAARKEEAGDLPLFNRAPPPSGGTGGPPVVSGGSPDTNPARSAALGDPSPKATRYSRRVLPHFERPWAKYFVTFRTIHRDFLSTDARDIVLNCIRHWNGQRYELFAACVMPDHVHLLIEPQIKESDSEGKPVFFPLSQILHTIKSFTAHKINALAGSSGTVWQDERYDRYIRSAEDLEEKFSYIVRNPWTAQLVETTQDYPWVWYPGVDQQVSPSARAPEVSEASRLEPRAGGPFHPDSAAEARKSSSPEIFVGTHALLYEGSGVKNLGLAVIDEQHKFGVVQRAKLREQGVAPDMLVMTATPIPRTLTMTVYGDLDISTLDELPKGRGRIATAVRDEAKLPEAVKFLREHLEAGRQAYIVYPLIDESEKLEAKAAAAEHSRWQELLAPMKCELLHGRVPPEEKEAIMERFRHGETKALIATTVIEVGIDVPNASIMLIENGERFGLAQLHQLRGRIGRGEHKSYCIVLQGTKADDGAKEKLAIFGRTIDGFEIAEEDLRIRGPGDILGTAQSGLPPLKIGDVFKDADLMKLARNAAFLVFERDPQLQQPEHAHLQELLANGRRAEFSQVS